MEISSLWGQILTIISESGIWAMLFVALLIILIRSNNKREEKYQEVISKLGESLKKVEEIKEDVEDLKFTAGIGGNSQLAETIATTKSEIEKPSVLSKENQNLSTNMILINECHVQNGSPVLSYPAQNPVELSEVEPKQIEETTGQNTEYLGQQQEFKASTEQQQAVIASEQQTSVVAEQQILAEAVTSEPQQVQDVAEPQTQPQGGQYVN